MNYTTLHILAHRAFGGVLLRELIVYIVSLAWAYPLVSTYRNYTMLTLNNIVYLIWRPKCCGNGSVTHHTRYEQVSPPGRVTMQAIGRSDAFIVVRDGTHIEDTIYSATIAEMVAGKSSWKRLWSHPRIISLHSAGGIIAMILQNRIHVRGTNRVLVSISAGCIQKPSIIAVTNRYGVVNYVDVPHYAVNQIMAWPATQTTAYATVQELWVSCDTRGFHKRFEGCDIQFAGNTDDAIVMCDGKCYQIDLLVSRPLVLACVPKSLCVVNDTIVALDSVGRYWDFVHNKQITNMSEFTEDFLFPANCLFKTAGPSGFVYATAQGLHQIFPDGSTDGPDVADMYRELIDWKYLGGL